MNERVLARMIWEPEFGQRSVLEAGPGTMWVIGKRLRATTDDNWNVCCPGCGTRVYALSAHPIKVRAPDGSEYVEPGYTFTGDASRPETLSVLELVEFVPCGCGPWRLTNGWWRAQPSKLVIVP